jgi:hypothetical protein
VKKLKVDKLQFIRVKDGDMEHVARVPNGCTVVSTVGIDPMDVFKTRVGLENKYKPRDGINKRINKKNQMANLVIEEE